jgi:hypothetical protein
MHKPLHTVYFDRHTGTVRRVRGHRDQASEPNGERPCVLRWDRQSPISWQEFIERWERRFAS